jgi:hypothetical protein
MRNKKRTPLSPVPVPNFYAMPYCYDYGGDRLIPCPAIDAIDHGTVEQMHPSVMYKTSHQQSWQPPATFPPELPIHGNKRKTSPQRDVAVHWSKVPKISPSVHDDIPTVCHKKKYGIILHTETEFTMDDLNELMRL